ncbi:PilN domain-containing protein [Herbaspirillum sp. alder98]|uniref:PilN domain-containing protein n=1 Tax=Herbaspirillum sp. alder98 TaxID=2913096 RepID=UPI001CD88B97|nr:PilN domain-containing protein [Herbaspirillum sp. alder98]MCA1323582.1 PilN domain-containing protein [Herbaspirillum sp. alder98]
MAIAGLSLCVFLALHIQSKWKTVQAGQQRLLSLQQSLARQQERQLPSRREDIPAERANAVNQAVSQLNLPWRDVLDALELATPGSIALLSMEPDAVKRTLKCVAEARDGEAMLAYLEQLKRAEFFDSVVLLRHELVEKDPGKPIRFQFDAHWPMAKP